MNATATIPPTQSTMRRHLSEILSPHWLAIFSIAGVILLGACLGLVPPLIMKQIVDQHLTTGNADGLWLLAFTYLLAVAGVQGLGFLSNYLTALTAQSALKDLRVRLYPHLQILPIRYYDQTSLGDTIEPLQGRYRDAHTLFSSGVAGLWKSLVGLVTVSIAMILLSPCSP